MSLFAEYIYPLTGWIKEHPNLALLVTFLISFTESVAIIGSIIPGSVTMTAIGILAGSGVMRIDLTLIASILGAIVGDSSSYLIGYTLRDRITHVWPFNRYPNWILYGKEYFAKHGGKSLLIGRFIGPLRSIIPVIAGMVQMEQWRFFLANFISAIGWSMLYVFPGIFIGAASNELPPEVASRLFILIIIFLLSIWLLTLLLKWFLVKIRHVITVFLENFWNWSAKQIILKKILKLFTPTQECGHNLTATYILLLLFSITSFFLLTLSIISFYKFNNLNDAIYLFLQSLRTPIFDNLFIIIYLTLTPSTLILFSAGICLILIYAEKWRSVYYWLLLILVTTIILISINTIITYSKPQGLIKINTGNSYPSITMGYSTAFLTTILFYLNTGLTIKKRFIYLVSYVLIFLLFLQGFAILYLGEHWFTDLLGAYFCGFSIALFIWLFYRRQKIDCANQNKMAGIIIFLLIISNGISSIFSYEQLLAAHQLYIPRYEIDEKLWWQQNQSILPIFRVNRIGRPKNFFNIQYVGSLIRLEKALEASGWKKENYNFISILLARMSWHQKDNLAILSLINPLYLNKKPFLIMSSQENNRKLILYLWKSNYSLLKSKQVIWIGTIQSQKLISFSNFPLKAKDGVIGIDLINELSLALSNFEQLRVVLPPNININKKLSTKAPPEILLIKEKK